MIAELVAGSRRGSGRGKVAHRGRQEQSGRVFRTARKVLCFCQGEERRLPAADRRGQRERVQTEAGTPGNRGHGFQPGTLQFWPGFEHFKRPIHYYQRLETEI